MRLFFAEGCSPVTSSGGVANGTPAMGQGGATLFAEELGSPVGPSGGLALGSPVEGRSGDLEAGSTRTAAPGPCAARRLCAAYRMMASAMAEHMSAGYAAMLEVRQEPSADLAPRGWW